MKPKELRIEDLAKKFGRKKGFDCLKEGVPYDKEAVEYWLEGILRCEGVDKVLHMARNAPFARKKTTRSVGYASTTEVEE